MSITWTQNFDSRSVLGPNSIQQVSTASFGASDYATGGYPAYPQNFGLSAIRGLIPTGYTASGPGAPGGYVWQAFKPAISGPAASNPWFIKAFQTASNGGQLIETASNTNFSGGMISWSASGY